MSVRCRLLLLITTIVVSSTHAVAQGSAQAGKPGRWKDIGKTSTGNTVLLDAKSVKKGKDGIITATMQMPYSKPYETPQGKVVLSRATAKFDCAKRQIAVLESTTFSDLAGTKVMNHSAPKIPGFGTVFTSNYSGVALGYLCAQ